MTRILLLIMATILGTFFLFTPASAWYEKNPDHVTSLGISLGLGGGAGTADVTAGGLTASQDISTGVFDLTFDLLAPMADSLSLFGGLSLIGISTDGDETSLLAGQEASTFGVNARIGLRIYFQK